MYVFASGLAIPTSEESDVYVLLGTLLTLRHLLPKIATSMLEHSDAKKGKQSLISMKQIIQVGIVHVLFIA